MAGDHGVVEEGVSAFPQQVTAQMMIKLYRGGAAINVLARHVGAEVIVVDCGVAFPLDEKQCLKVKRLAWVQKYGNGSCYVKRGGYSGYRGRH